MFGWMKNKIRNDHIRLVKQNQLAVEYLYEFSQNAFDSKLDSSPNRIHEMKMLEEVADIQEDLIEKLKIHNKLIPDVFTDQYNLQKHLRRMYDEIKAGKVAFANMFGTSNEKIMSFDQRFQPNEGWKIFLNHFGG
jgi:hypothetical protein